MCISQLAEFHIFNNSLDILWIDYTGKVIAVKSVTSFLDKLKVGFSTGNLASGLYHLKIAGVAINLGYKI